MRPTRRHLLTASLGLAASAAGADRARPARGAESSLTFAGFAGLFQDLYDSAVLTPFQDAHPEAGIFYYGLPSSVQVLATLRRQKQQPAVDVALLDLPSARAATEENLVEPLPPALLRDLAPTALFPGIAGPALFSEPLVLLYDPAVMPPPRSWLGLWNSPDRKTIAVAAPPNPAGLAFTLTAARLFGNGNDRRAVEGGMTAIAELSRRVVTWDPRPDIDNLIADGGARLGAGWNMPAQVMIDRRPGRLGVVFPDEGTISRVVTVNLVKGSRRPDAARLLIAHMLSEAAQKAMVATMYLGPVNAKARYSGAALTRTANTRERAARAMPVDWIAAEAMRPFILDRWRESVPGAAL